MVDTQKLTAKEAAEILGVSKTQILRLIKKGKLEAELQEYAPVPYYLISYETIETYKLMPKDKGGRPSKKSDN